jgi:hypothetical protein
VLAPKGVFRPILNHVTVAVVLLPGSVTPVVPFTSFCTCSYGTLHPLQSSLLSLPGTYRCADTALHDVLTACRLVNAADGVPYVCTSKWTKQGSVHRLRQQAGQLQGCRLVPLLRAQHHKPRNTVLSCQHRLGMRHPRHWRLLTLLPQAACNTNAEVAAC